MSDEKHNTGANNTGYRNTGSYNAGMGNAGDHNTGSYNAGSYNAGYSNAGVCNTGSFNAGDQNTGNWNTGDYNIGDYNTGDFNTGDYNSGMCNTGDYNTGDYNSGYFCTETPSPMFFDRPTDLEWSEVEIPHMDIPVGCEWVSHREMSEQEMADNPNWYYAGGYLKKHQLSIQEAFPIAWEKADEETKRAFLELPNFDADKFLECTGVDVRKEGLAEHSSPERIQFNGEWYVKERP